MNHSTKNQRDIYFNGYVLKRVLSFTFSLLFATSVTYSQDNLQTIKVSVDNVNNDLGKVIFSLHSQDTFMTKESLQRAEGEIVNNKVEVVFENVVSGTYAIMVLHDENENYKMDFDNDGMPIESYGMSNNPLSYGPPQFIDAKFDVLEEDLEFKIRF